MAGIPGYYFDDEKKRYFRSPPEHLAYTMPDMPSKSAPSSTHNPHCSSSTVATRPQRECTLASALPKSLYDLTTRISRFHDPFTTLRYALPQAVVCNSKCRKLDDAIEVGGHHVSHIVLNEAGSMVALSTSSSEISKFFVLEIYVWPEKRFNVPVSAMELFPSYYSADHTMMGPNICVTSYDKSELVMYSHTLGVRVGVLTPTSSCVRNRESYWNSCGDRSALSNVPVDALASTTVSEKVLGAISTHHGRVKVFSMPDMQSIRTCHSVDKSSVFSLTFHQEPLLLYAGTRSGTVVTWDLRSKKSVSSASVANKGNVRTNPSVIQMHTLDGNYLIASCLTSKILLWDCRMNRPVLTYPGHQNSYHSCRSCVDHSQSFLAAVGEDKSIRIWSLWKGTLLRTISEAEYVINEGLFDGEIPAISYSDHLGGLQGKPALLIATHEGLTSLTIIC